MNIVSCYKSSLHTHMCHWREVHNATWIISLNSLSSHVGSERTYVCVWHWQQSLELDIEQFCFVTSWLVSSSWTPHPEKGQSSLAHWEKDMFLWDTFYAGFFFKFTKDSISLKLVCKRSCTYSADQYIGPQVWKLGHKLAENIHISDKIVRL